MIMSPVFKSLASQQGDLVIQRAGLAKELILPEALKNRATYDADVEGNKIVLSEGSSVYILTDKFGLVNRMGDVDANIFFVENGLVIELVEGSILLQGSNGESFLVDETGDVDYIDEFAKHIWVTHTELFEKATMVMKHRYATPEHVTPSYVHNLVMNVIMSYGAKIGEPCLSIRFVEQYEDLGLDSFNFFNYNEAAQFEADDDFDGDLEDLDDDEEELEFEYDMSGDAF